MSYQTHIVLVIDRSGSMQFVRTYAAASGAVMTSRTTGLQVADLDEEIQ